MQYPRTELAWPEIWMATTAGLMRRIHGIQKGRCDKFGDSPVIGWGNDINGAIAEFGAAKILGVFWSGTVGRIDLPDVGHYQVRCKIKAHNHLILRPEDSDGEVFISAWLDLPHFAVELHGWLYGREAKREEWWREPPAVPYGGFFAPCEALRPIEELPR